MRSMRWSVALGLLFLVPLAVMGADQPVMCLGHYVLTAETGRDIMLNDYHEFAPLNVLTEKPPGLTVEIAAEVKDMLTFGFLELGPLRQQINLAMVVTKDYGVESLYVDANHDGLLTAQEQVPIKTEPAYRNQDGYEWQWSKALNPVSARLLMSGSTDRSSIIPWGIPESAFFATAPHSTSASEYQLAPLFYFYMVDTWFSGTGRFTRGTDEEDFRFALADGNDNGVFNDFGRDYLMVDFDRNGRFDSERETSQLVEFEEVKNDPAVQRRKTPYSHGPPPWSFKLGRPPWIARRSSR